jgi:hypothetical protein
MRNEKAGLVLADMAYVHRSQLMQVDNNNNNTRASDFKVKRTRFQSKGTILTNGFCIPHETCIESKLYSYVTFKIIEMHHVDMCVKK